jgi:magnesium chelatase family protein
MASLLLLRGEMLAHVYAASLAGIEAWLVKVEVDVLSKGLPGWSMVGLLETAVKEAKDRVGGAIRNAGFAIPNRKTVINLSPADVKKNGAHYDLPIAVALLIAAGASLLFGTLF